MASFSCMEGRNRHPELDALRGTARINPVKFGLQGRSRKVSRKQGGEGAGDTMIKHGKQ